MSSIDLTIKCSKELTELGEGVAKFLEVLMEESKDGLDITDISPILASAVSDLVPALDGVTEVADELIEDREAFVNAVGVTGSRIINVFI